MKFVLQGGSQQRVSHTGSGSKAAVHLCLLGRWMPAEGGTVLDEVRVTALRHHRRTRRLAVDEGVYR